MKHVSLLAAAVIALALAAQPAGAAELKIATVNLKKTFDEYWKTKQADKQLKDEASVHEKKYKEMMEDLKKADEEYRKLAESANDTAIADAEKERRRGAAARQFRTLQDMDASIKAWMRSTDASISEKKRNLREKILTEIRSYIEARARAGSFTLVLDNSAESVSNTPVILYAIGIPDLTEELLKQLNATAPPVTADAGTKPPEAVSKDFEKKESKK